MGRKRRRSSNGGRHTRRTYLATGCLLFGSGLLVTDSNAVPSVLADRTTSVGVSPDETALLGLDIVSSVEAGKSGQSLMTVSNNAAVDLSVSVSLRDPSQGSVSPQNTTLGVDSSAPVSVSVASDSPTGENALPVDVTATDGETTTVSLTRRVAVSSSPTLNRSVTDRTANNTADYEVSYQVLNLESFDRIEVTFENTDNGWATETKTGTQPEGGLSYQAGGTGSDTYDITFEVYDTADTVVIQESVTDIADGSDPSDNDDISGGSDDPVLESFTVTDDTQYDTTDFTLEYGVSPRENFRHVRVTFDNTNSNNNWSDETQTNSDSPSGSVTYQHGGTEGDTYEITVETINQNGIVTDSGTVTVLAGANETTTYQ